MSLSFRISFFIFLLTICAYLFTYGYVESIYLPNVPNFESSYYFFIKTFLTPFIALVLTSTTAICYKLKNIGILKIKKIYKVLIIAVVLGLIIALVYFDSFHYKSFPVVFFLLTSYLVFSDEIPYAEKTEKADKNFWYLISVSCFTALVFYLFGGQKYLVETFNTITLVTSNGGKTEEVTPLWSQDERVFAIKCPVVKNSFLDIKIKEYKDGELRYVHGNVPRDVYNIICK